LTLKESMRNLNKRRVNIKHYGLLPSKIDVETSRGNVSDFFDQNTASCFDIEFENISLIYLIDSEEIRSCLVKAQNALAKEDYKESIENSSIAFHKMILIYENSKTYFTNSSPFSFRRKRLKLDIQQLELGDRRKVDEVMSYISERFDFIEEIVKVLSVGIDYRKYLKFKIIAPKVLHYGKNEYECQIFEEDSWTKEQCEYCFDFVIETALTLQAFDFDIEEIMKNPFV